MSDSFKNSQEEKAEGRMMPGLSWFEMGLKVYRAISHHTFIYLLFVFIILHLHTEGFQNPPQLTWLDQTSLVNINKFKGFDNSFNVFENLCMKNDLGEVKRSSVRNQSGNKICKRF